MIAEGDKVVVPQTFTGTHQGELHGTPATGNQVTWTGIFICRFKDGKIVGMLRDVAYQSNTQEFWNSCVAACDDRDYRLGGSFFDGKGQPGQVSAVSHGSATTRFNGVNVINTERKI